MQVINNLKNCRREKNVYLFQKIAQKHKNNFHFLQTNENCDQIEKIYKRTFFRTRDQSVIRKFEIKKTEKTEGAFRKEKKAGQIKRGTFYFFNF